MDNEDRRDPESFLRRFEQEEQEEQQEKGVGQIKGQLKIFLGAAAGVGKTYQMLEEAHSLRKKGADVIVAIAETHGRPETQALLQDLEVIPRLHIDHEGIVLEEMDLDAVLARHPTIALVDELAHANPPELRHAKRYQDIEELLQAGISVYTTLNIQHIESLNDIVYQITGVRVTETLPDNILESADEIEVVDLPPEELLQRLKDGKVYFPPQAKLAMRRFFRKGNLIGLRELALRYAARKVGDDMRSYMEGHGILGPWQVGSRLLVCISTSSLSERLIRTGQRMAADLDAEWFAVHVESPREKRHDELAKDQLARNMNLAEELGAKVQVLSGLNIAQEIISFAREHNVTLIIAGLPHRSLWNRLFRGSVVNEITGHSGQIHVLVIGSTEAEQMTPEKPIVAEPIHPEGDRPLQLFYGGVALAIMVVFCWIFQQWLGLINITLMLLLPVVYSAMNWGRNAGLITSILAVVALDFFFYPPRLSITILDFRYAPIFFVFVIVGMVISVLTDQVRWQGESARQRERFVSSLYSFSRDVMAARNIEDLLQYATREISEAFECEVMILLPDETEKLQVRAQKGENLILDERRLGVATWVFHHGQPAGHGTETLSSASLFYLPMMAKEVPIGVIGVRLSNPDKVLSPEQRRLLESFANILAIALARGLPSSDKKQLFDLLTEFWRKGYKNM